MWFEYLMMFALLVAGVFLIGIPIYNFVQEYLPKKRNALQEARERLEQARLDKEAARLNKEAEKLYEEMYQEAVQDEQDEDKQEKHK